MKVMMVFMIATTRRTHWLWLWCPWIYQHTCAVCLFGMQSCHITDRVRRVLCQHFLSIGVHPQYIWFMISLSRTKSKARKRCEKCCVEYSNVSFCHSWLHSNDACISFRFTINVLIRKQTCVSHGLTTTTEVEGSEIYCPTWHIAICIL